MTGEFGHDAGMKASFPRSAARPVAGRLRDTVAKTAVDVVTLPVKVVAAGVDAATTSQSEADEKRGRELRKAEEAAGKRSANGKRPAKRPRSAASPARRAPTPTASASPSPRRATS